MKNVKKMISSVLAAVISLSSLGGAALAQDAELNRSFLMYEDFEDFDIDTQFKSVGKWSDMKAYPEAAYSRAYNTTGEHGGRHIKEIVDKNSSKKLHVVYDAAAANTDKNNSYAIFSLNDKAWNNKDTKLVTSFNIDFDAVVETGFLMFGGKDINESFAKSALLSIKPTGSQADQVGLFTPSAGRNNSKAVGTIGSTLEMTVISYYPENSNTIKSDVYANGDLIWQDEGNCALSEIGFVAVSAKEGMGEYIDDFMMYTVPVDSDEVLNVVNPTQNDVAISKDIKIEFDGYLSKNCFTSNHFQIYPIKKDGTRGNEENKNYITASVEYGFNIKTGEIKTYATIHRPSIMLYGTTYEIVLSNVKSRAGNAPSAASVFVSTQTAPSFEVSAQFNTTLAEAVQKGYITVDASVLNTTGRAVNGTVLFAAYDADKKLVGYTYMKADFDSDETQKFKSTLDIPESAEDIKVYVCDDITAINNTRSNYVVLQ